MTDDEDGGSKDEVNSEETEKKAKRVKKLKLGMSDEQYFEDGREVWT